MKMKSSVKFFFPKTTGYYKGGGFLKGTLGMTITNIHELCDQFKLGRGNIYLYLH